MSKFLFGLYIAGMVFFLFAIDHSVDDGGMILTAKYFSIPVSAVVLVVFWMNRKSLYVQFGSATKAWISVLMVCPMALLSVWPYVLALNAITGAGEEISYTGRIVDGRVMKDSHANKQYVIDVKEDGTGRLIMFTVTPEQFKSVQKGARIKITFLRGGFGLPYRWKFNHHTSGMQPVGDDQGPPGLSGMQTSPLFPAELIVYRVFKKNIMPKAALA